MAKASPKMKSTMGLTPVRKEINLDNIVPKTGPGIVVWDHQRANAAEAKLAAIEAGKVKISDLYEVEGRKRSLTAEDFEQLKNNLTSNPLVNAIVVRARKQGGYEIISGHNRVQAYKELGRLEIEADIREFEEDLVFEAAFYSNLINSPLTDFEKYLGFKEIIEKTGETQKEVGGRAGVNTDYISDLFAFGKLPADALRLVEENPHLIGKATATVLKDYPEKAAAAIRKIADEKYTEKAAIAFVREPAVPKPRPVKEVFKAGKKAFAEFKINGHLLVIDIKDESKIEGIKEKIRALLTAEVEE